MIEVKELYKSFDGFPVLNGVDLHVGNGAVYGLVGPNGAGKSTGNRYTTIPRSKLVWRISRMRFSISASLRSWI